MDRLTKVGEDGYVYRFNCEISDADAWNKLAHYEDLAEQGRLVDIETYQKRLIRYIDAGKYRSADKKVFSENDVVYLIEHGIFPCKTEAERAPERKKNENIKNT